MFALFFSENRVRTFEDATSSATDHYKKVFHHALEHGLYLPPSPYETSFLCTAHEGETIDRAAEVLSNAIREL